MKKTSLFQPFGGDRLAITVVALGFIVAASGCATSEDVRQVDKSVNNVNKSLAELSESVTKIQIPIVVKPRARNCKTGPRPSKIDLYVQFAGAEGCWQPVIVTSGDNGCEDQTKNNLACVCRNNARNEKITWHARDISTQGNLNLVYSVIFGPFSKLTSKPSGKIMDKTILSATPEGSYKYAVVVEGENGAADCVLDPHIIIDD